MKAFLGLILFCPYFLVAQQHGIDFVQNTNWQQILAKAKAEHKFIFVDCYASWCGPCKNMDKNVYPNDTVGAFMNEHFIAVKVQMDSTAKDNENTRNWYSDAHEMAHHYKIYVYPSFLFFSPDGNPVHRDVGYHSKASFITLAKTAMDPNTQYYTLLDHYEHGSRDYRDMLALEAVAQKIKEDSMAARVARDYIRQYLEALPKDQLWTKENLQFINAHVSVINSDDKLFKQYFQDRKMIDSIMQTPDYTMGLINYIVYKEEVAPKVAAGLKSRTEPEWHEAEKQIEKKYGEKYGKKNILKGRTAYYRSAGENENYAKYFVLEMEDANIDNWPSGVITGLALNNDAFEVFKYSTDKKDLEKALTWVDRSLAMGAKSVAEKMDTKANLLYKLGKRDEAIALEEQSLAQLPNNKDIQEALEKMKNGVPTWSSQAGK